MTNLLSQKRTVSARAYSTGLELLLLERLIEVKGSSGLLEDQILRHVMLSRD